MLRMKLEIQDLVLLPYIVNIKTEQEAVQHARVVHLLDVHPIVLGIGNVQIRNIHLELIGKIVKVLMQMDVLMQDTSITANIELVILTTEVVQHVEDVLLD